MNATANLPAERRETSPIEVLKGVVARRADDFKMVLPSHISVEKFQRTIATAALSNPTLLTCDRQSLLIAAMKLAQDGLLPDGREAALVPFKNRVKGDDGEFRDKWLVQAMPMAYGLRKKVLQSGEVVNLQVGVVYAAEVESGNFIYEIGMEPPIRHRPKLDLTEAEMSDANMVAAYSIARIKNDNGDPYWSVEVMRRVEIMKVRQTSQTGALGRTIKFGKNAGKPIEPKGPWVEWEPEMWKKSVLRRHTKVLPMSGDILDTFQRDEAEERAAESAEQFLAVEPHAPLAIPTPAELQDDSEQHDPETGEVTTNATTGMTEVGEEAARALDAQPEAEPESEAEPEAEAEQPAAAEEPVWKAHVSTLRAQIAAANTKLALAKADQKFLNMAAGLPDDVKNALELELTGRRRAIEAKGAEAA